jgi:hypothetical protein
MAVRPGCVQLLAGRLGIVDFVDQTKKFDLSRQGKRVDPPSIRIYQIRRSRKYNDLTPNCCRNKNKKLSGVPATNLIAHRQGANHVSYPAEAANDDCSLSMPRALENQPHDERHPFSTLPLKAEKPTPPRPQCGTQWTR